MDLLKMIEDWGKKAVDFVVDTATAIGEVLVETGKTISNWIRSLWEDLFCDYTPLFPYRIASSNQEGSLDGVVESVTGPEKSKAVAFVNSDVAECFGYRDSGVRHSFELLNSTVHYSRGNADATQPLLFGNPPNYVPSEHVLWGRVGANKPTSISYTNKRTSEVDDLPDCDLIAAGGGRIFVKEKGYGRFYFAAMQDEFLHHRARDNQHDFRDVPGFYFKLDPQFNATKRAENVPVYWWEQAYHDHPQSRNYRWMLTLKKILLPDVLLIRVFPKVFHLLDTRLACPWILPDIMRFSNPPNWVESYEHVVYRRLFIQTKYPQYSIKMYNVVDIGVGHVHWYMAYDRSCGGELDPLKNDMMRNLYQLFNGPIEDRGGFCDGTCNFYVLCKIKVYPESGERSRGSRYAYAILFLDEQSYFAERWHLLSPRDGRRFPFLRDWALAGGAGINSGPPSEGISFNSMCYKFDKESYWSPFEDDWFSENLGYVHFDDSSRLAVARQVILVTGNHKPAKNPDQGRYTDDKGTPPEPDRTDDPTSTDAPPEIRPVIFSTNFSWATMDRTWRWRNLPGYGETCHVVRRENLPAPGAYESGASYCCRETLRLRDDMTILVEGVKWIPELKRHKEGVWYQKYLPADCREIPLTQARDVPYRHGWHFMPKEHFARADAYSHFGVYEKCVDSRRQYYRLDLSEYDLSRMPENSESIPWVDIGNRLSVTVSLSALLSSISTIPDHPISLWRFWLAMFQMTQQHVAQQVGNTAGIDAILSALSRLLENPSDNSPLPEQIVNFLENQFPDSVQVGPETYCPPSRFNKRTLFRLLYRHNLGWIAVHWDKRDDELAGFTSIGENGQRVKIKPCLDLHDSRISNAAPPGNIEMAPRFQGQQQDSMPPVVQVAKVIIDTQKRRLILLFYSRIKRPPSTFMEDEQDFPPEETVWPYASTEFDSAFFDAPENAWLHEDVTDYLEHNYDGAIGYNAPPSGGSDPTDTSIWRVKIGLPQIGPICDLVVPAVFKRKSAHVFWCELSENDNLSLGPENEYNWDNLQSYVGSPEEAFRQGASVWFEDIIGHVRVPEKVIFWGL